MWLVCECVYRNQVHGWSMLKHTFSLACCILSRGCRHAKEKLPCFTTATRFHDAFITRSKSLPP